MMIMSIFNRINYFFSGDLCNEKPYISDKVLIKELSQFRPIQTLLEEAKLVLQEFNLPELKVHLERTRSGFRADQQGNIIRIDPDLPASEQRYSAIFELNNLIQLKVNVKIINDTVKSVFKSSEEYVRAVEFMEYNSVKRTRSIARQINKLKGSFFKPYIKITGKHFPVEIMGFNFYYNYFLGTRHKEHHRKNWKLTCTKFNIKICNDIQTGRNENSQKILYIGVCVIGFFGMLGNLYRLLNTLIRMR
jgi:hypothetical protein